MKRLGDVCRQERCPAGKDAEAARLRAIRMELTNRTTASSRSRATAPMILVHLLHRSRGRADDEAADNCGGPQFEALARRDDQQHHRREQRKQGRDRVIEASGGLSFEFVAHRPQGKRGQQHSGQVRGEQELIASARSSRLIPTSSERRRRKPGW